MESVRKIEKLISEYNQKVKLCDDRIDQIYTNIEAIRSTKYSELEYSEYISATSDWTAELKIIDVKKQAYIQAICDLNEILETLDDVI